MSSASSSRPLRTAPKIACRPRIVGARALAELSVALDIYAPLMTERRTRALRLYFDEDLSYAEVAARMRISRQGVHEHVSEGLKMIGRFESRLGLVGKTLRARQRLLEVARLLRNERPRTRSTTLDSRSLARVAGSLERLAGEL
jgi:predicted DNA-binding protein YlxM (UPF0122 family)